MSDSTDTASPRSGSEDGQLDAAPSPQPDDPATTTECGWDLTPAPEAARWTVLQVRVRVFVWVWVVWGWGCVCCGVVVRV